MGHGITIEVIFFKGFPLWKFFKVSENKCSPVIREARGTGNQQNACSMTTGRTPMGGPGGSGAPVGDIGPGQATSRPEVSGGLGRLGRVFRPPREVGI